jgi:hypothetical protein
VRTLSNRLVAASHVLLALMVLATSADAVAAHSTDFYQDMHWRSIGPPRAGRTRALAGVPSQRNVFYIGFDNGGVWCSTDYGSTWVPISTTSPPAPSAPSRWPSPTRT